MFFKKPNVGGFYKKASEYGHLGIKFIPLGGVSAATLKDFLAAPGVAAVGGSWIADRALIKAGDWAGITKLAKEAVAIASGT